MNRWLLCGVILCAGALPALGQELPDKPKPQVHRFFDKTNKALWGGLVVMRVLDYHSTYAALRNGAVEMPFPRGMGGVVKSKPGFAAYQAATVFGTIGAAYWLHRKGHHRWERVASAVQIVWIGKLTVNNYRLASSRHGG